MIYIKNVYCVNGLAVAFWVERPILALTNPRRELSGVGDQQFFCAPKLFQVSPVDAESSARQWHEEERFGSVAYAKTVTKQFEDIANRRNLHFFS